ncbi:hypothetical protein FVER14953_20967 [Fusarium verticillioides]|nr:hypothetical protein FVER14953_20967 [Fusarium verticillioides]
MEKGEFAFNFISKIITRQKDLGGEETSEKEA